MPLTTLSIALFDDDRLRRRRLTEIFRSMPIIGKVQVLASRAELVKIAELGQLFDFVVIGKEQNATALTLLTTLREQVAAYPPPVVLLTAAEAGTPYVSQLYECGAVAFLSEPLSVQGVANTFTSLVESRAMRTSTSRSLVSSVRVSLRFASRLIDERAGSLILNRRPGFRILKEWASLKRWFSEKVPALTPEDYIQALDTEFSEAKPFEARATSAKRAAKVREHPSIHVNRLITARGLSTERFKELMNLDDALLSEFMSGKTPMTAEIAAALSRVVGNDPAFWLRYE